MFHLALMSVNSSSSFLSMPAHNGQAEIMAIISNEPVTRETIPIGRMPFPNPSIVACRHSTYGFPSMISLVI